MKNTIWIVGCLLFVVTAFGQTCVGEKSGCDCPSCQEKAAAGSGFTLPGLQGLEQADEHADCDHDHGAEEVGSDEHAEHDPVAEEAGHEDHSSCDHAQEVENAAHAGHDHDAPEEHAGEAAAGGVEVSAEMAKKIGLQINEAAAGPISKSVVFPAEIALNRDRSAAVSPRYASIVRQGFVEIGDKVKAGDVLASLENRETMAVFTVSAPLDGVIVSKDLAVGESADEERVLFEVVDLSTVWADISIFPQYQHLIRKGMAVEFVAHDGHTARGSVKYISPLVSHETRTFTARCVLEGADEDFTPGAFVRASIVTESKTVPVRVECAAVQNVAGQSVVFIQDEHGFESRDVVIGMADEQFVEILRGLQPGERYISAGSFALKAEMVTSGMDPHAGCGH